MIIGKHTLECKPIESLDFKTLLGGRKANILYSDPPWGDGNLKYWTTINEKQTGKKFSPLDYNTLLGIFRDLIKNNVDGYCFIECSFKDLDLLEERFKGILFNVKKFAVEYQGGTNGILFGGTSPNYAFNIDLTGMSGFKMVDLCIKECPGEIVIDPCCGFGWTARAAVKNGRTFVGNEFNSERIQRTMTELLK